VKQAILATVVSVERQSLDSVVVWLQSDALEDAAEIVSTGLNLEQSKKRSGSRLQVTCKGEPKAAPGDKVPVVVKPENREQAGISRAVVAREIPG
jgi:hypothetical protein